ncbi:MAG TPA: hypothetical protein VII48_09175, partial [Rhizomicrobium sp.]
RLRAKGEVALRARFHVMTGKIRSVLVEKPGFGHSECFAPVTFDGVATPGSIVPVLITGADGTRLLGKAA